MIYINRPINVEKIKFILCDFDRTISISNSPTSWGIFSTSQFTSPNFKEETMHLYDMYRPIETDHYLSLAEKKRVMYRWTNEQVMLFSKYDISYDDYLNICYNDNGIILRHDFSNFVHEMYELGISIHIISAGLFEPIKCKLERSDALLPNVDIISNHVRHDENRKITGISGKTITSMNKDEVLGISSDEQGILFGDLPADKLMATNLKTIDVGFANSSYDIPVFNKEFDITLTGKSSFTSVSKILIKK